MKSRSPVVFEYKLYRVIEQYSDTFQNSDEYYSMLPNKNITTSPLYRYRLVLTMLRTGVVARFISRARALILVKVKINFRPQECGLVHTTVAPSVLSQSTLNTYLLVVHRPLDESTHLDAFSLATTNSTKSLIDKYFTTYCRTLSNRRSKTLNESSDSHRIYSDIFSRRLDLTLLIFPPERIL